MKGPQMLTNGLLLLSILLFLAGIAGLIFYRWVQPASSLTAAWSNALSTFGVFAAAALFFGIMAIYSLIKAGARR